MSVNNGYEMRRVIAWSVMVNLGLWTLGEPTRAQPAPQSDAEQRRQTAQELVNKAAELHNNLLFARAVEAYREALTYWESAAVRYHLSRALEAMGKPLEAYENLLLALPELDASRRAQALEFKPKLMRQLAEVEVRCRQPGVRVTLDGAFWFVCPDHRKKFVRPGYHVIAATKADHLDRTEQFHLLPSTVGRATLRLVSYEQGTITTRRWAPWKPWALLAAGLSAGGAGVGIRVKAARLFEDFDDEVDGCITSMNMDVPRPCPADDVPEDILARARRHRDIAIGAFVVSGVLIVAGVTLLGFNQAHTQRSTTADGFQIEVLPTLTGGGGSLTIGASF